VTSRYRHLALLACAISMCCSRAPATPPTDASAAAPPWFEDVAERAGIRFVHQSGHRDTFYLPEIMGGGAALFDMDNDGFLDLYLVQSGRLSLEREGFSPFEREGFSRASIDRSARGGNRLYRNRGDGTFEDVTAGSGTDEAGYGMGVAAGDVDNDGNVDLYVTNVARGQRARREAVGALFLRPVRGAERVVPRRGRITIRRGAAARRHPDAAGRHEPRGGFRRHRQRRRDRHPRHEP
jgi:hypothetical protein